MQVPHNLERVGGARDRRLLRSNTPGHHASEQGGNDFRRIKDLNLEAKARIWPCLSYVCRIYSKAGWLPLESTRARIMKPVYSETSHVISPVQASGHGLTAYWETVHVTGTNFTIQHSRYTLSSPGVVRALWRVRAWIFGGYSRRHLHQAVPCRCRATMAHVRQSRPDSGTGFQVKVI